MKIACGYTIPITLFGIPPSPENHLKAMEIVGQAGFQAMELELYDELLPAHRRDIQKMQAVLDRYGMSVPSIMTVEEQMFSTDQTISERAVNDFDSLTDLICELKSPLVAICGYMPPEIRPKGTELYTGGPPTAVLVDDDFSWPAFWDHAVRMVDQFAGIAGSKGLTLLIETRANDWVGSVDSILHLIRDAKRDKIGVILDVAHVHAGKEYLSLVVRKLSDTIKLVHLSDNDSSFAYHYPPGRGNIDFPTLFHDLSLVGYDGTLVIDISGVDHIVEEAIQAREYFLGILGRLKLIRLSLSSFIYVNYPLDIAIQQISKAGYDGVDFWGGRPHAYRKDLNEADIEKIKVLLGELQLGVASFIPAQFRYPTCLCSGSEFIRQESIEYIKDSIQTAAALGSPVVSVCPGHSLFGQSKSAAWDSLRRSLDEICRFASSFPVRIAIEPADIYETDLINTGTDAMRMIDQLGYANLGLVLDTGHSHIVGEETAQVMTMAQDRLFHVHVDDNNGLRDQHLVPGQGSFNFPPFLEALDKVGYQGFLGVELSWDVTIDPDPAASQALKYLKSIK